MRHGDLIGLIVTLSVSIGVSLDSVPAFMMLTIFGLIYGFLIELFATKIFKAKMTQIGSGQKEEMVYRSECGVRCRM